MLHQIAYCFRTECMALRLYRRHRKECEVGRPEDFKSGEFEEGRRGWRHCGCPIHASGTIRGNFKRQSTGQWEWEAAKAVAAQWESTETWSLATIPSGCKTSLFLKRADRLEGISARLTEVRRERELIEALPTGRRKEQRAYLSCSSSSALKSVVRSGSSGGPFVAMMHRAPG